MEIANHNSSLVSDFRYRVAMALGFGIVPFLLPFSLMSFFQGRSVMGVSTLMIIGVSVVNAFSILRSDRNIISFGIYYAVALTTLVIGIASMGAVVVYWCYPTAFVALVILEHRQARLFIGIGMLFLFPCAFIYMESDYAIRFAITYLMSCYFGDRFVSLLDDLQARLTGLAITDPLTGTYNRRHLQACLADAIEEHRRGLNTASLIALDIDHFKEINDSLGHEAGDTVLKGLVEVIQNRTRKLDLVFRTGGEEFVILARNIDPEQVSLFAESLRKFIEQASFLDGQSLTVSLGIAHYEEGEDSDSWSRRADNHLYEAKKQGRNRVWPASE